MKIDEKYFIPFVILLAVISALIIVFFTIYNRDSNERSFAKRMMAQDSLKYKAMPTIDGNDSLSVQSFPNSYVIVSFWATWTSNFTKKADEQLDSLKRQFSQRLQILAAEVRDKPQNVHEYIKRYQYPFHYLNGSEVFSEFGVPGVPTQLVYAPCGKLLSIFTGYADAARMDSLQHMLKK